MPTPYTDRASARSSATLAAEIAAGTAYLNGIRIIDTTDSGALRLESPSSSSSTADLTALIETVDALASKEASIESRLNTVELRSTNTLQSLIAAEANIAHEQTFSAAFATDVNNVKDERYQEIRPGNKATHGFAKTPFAEYPCTFVGAAAQIGILPTDVASKPVGLARIWAFPWQYGIGDVPHDTGAAMAHHYIPGYTVKYMTDTRRRFLINVGATDAQMAANPTEDISGHTELL
ncbi:hypothetical protein [uncultured Paraglaciecola sp.]|uniref:hypothetical protein n=1 Tax=uncultured Paraglaciecola sp. TaxID=1765024 RepID=UPI0026114945|nr:hypothetical protein [uncultured Paraglaciecola sp.]